MNFSQIEENVKKVIGEKENESFLFRFLQAYGVPKSSITRLEKGDYNLSKNPNEVIWKKKLIFRKAEKADLYATIDQIKKSEPASRHDVRFVIVTDFKTLLAVDMDNDDSLDVSFSDIPKKFDFFLPLAGFEKSETPVESQADIKAAEKMARLYDELTKDNPSSKEKDIHSLNVFLSRLLFCFFAEDTEIFEKGAFTKSLSSLTRDDGVDLSEFFEKLFKLLNLEKRSSSSGILQAFPYVNGGLFAERLQAPKFSAKSRRFIIECGELDWSAINPDIFGSMIQAVVHPDRRGEMGMHYTSVANILKVINPLFMDQLRKEFEQAKGSLVKLEKLLAKIKKIRVFDPACGSGNFLIIAYKELRKIEMEIFTEIRGLKKQVEFQFSGIKLDQFFGIELDDFAHEVAVLSLWLVEHQMNLAFKERFGRTVPSLPLKQGGKVICGNACEVDWESLCPIETESQVFVLGNPPYLGSKNQEEEHKRDKAIALKDVPGAGVLDYISCWIAKAANYIRGNQSAEFAFVSTNSICQGEQVSLLWPAVLGNELEIRFAHQSFKWTNNAKNKAGVTCIIVGVRNKSADFKHLFSNGIRKVASNVNAYLVDAPDIYVHRESKPINGLPKMGIGNKPIDDSNYLFLAAEKAQFLSKEPGAAPYFRRWYGSEEFLNGVERWCLLAQAIPEEKLKMLPLVQERIEKVRTFRKKSKSAPTRAIAKTPMRFHVECFPSANYIVIPEVSSERREYIPVGYLSKDELASSLLRVAHTAETHIFGLLSSRIHMVWVKAVAGRLETRFRYSNDICYNTFPVPEFTPKQIEAINRNVLNVLQEREKHPGLTISDLYDPDTMPPELLLAHQQLDAAVEQCYRAKPFQNDDERLEFVFKLYKGLRAKSQPAVKKEKSHA